MLFKNLNTSPCEAFPDRWQQKIVDRIETEYENQAIKVSNEFLEKLKDIANAPAGYAGTFTKNALETVGRYCYIKNLEAPDGKTFDVEIDLLFHTVSFLEI